MGKIQNLSGRRFGKIIVIDRNFAVQKKNAHAMWNCVCDCGEKIIARSNNLLNGHTSSCGFCTYMGGNMKEGKHDRVYEYTDNKIKTKIKRQTRVKNKYEEIGDTVYVKMNNCNDVMLCDKKDWEIVKNITWHKNNKGYAAYGIDGSKEKFHQVIMPTKEGQMIDHINGNKLDNRRINLRIVSKSDNCFNCKRKTTVSGKTGVRLLPNGKWGAFITKNKIVHNLGVYKDLREAVEARKKAEIEFFGMYCRS